MEAVHHRIGLASFDFFFQVLHPGQAQGQGQSVVASLIPSRHPLKHGHQLDAGTARQAQSQSVQAGPEGDRRRVPKR